VAVDEMAPAGRLISHGMSSRFGLEGIIVSLDAGATGLPVHQWVVLGLLTASTITATALVLHRR
jgi:hypothetical protein